MKNKPEKGSPSIKKRRKQAIDMARQQQSQKSVCPKCGGVDGAHTTVRVSDNMEVLCWAS